MTAAEVQQIAADTDEVRELEGDPTVRPLSFTVATRGDELWELRVRNPGEREVRAVVVIDDASGQVTDVFTGEQIDTPLARGYEGAVAGKASSWWIWLPLCLLFLAPFVDPRRPLRVLHLDLLVLLGLSVSLFFFNRGEIGWSVVWVYPVLGYVLVRMAAAGFGFPAPGLGAAAAGSAGKGPLLPLTRRSWLVAGIVALAIFHVGYQVAEGKVIDVGVASVIGADRLTSGEDVYGEEFGSELPERGDVRGDVYGPVNYLAYSPFELVLPWEGVWDDVPAAQAVAVAFTLLTALALLFLGRRLRPAEEGKTLGVALAFAWLAYPFTLYTAASSFNDGLVALLVVCSLLAIASPPGRGALAALAGLTKFGPLALAPLLAAGTGDRRPRTLALFAGAFALTVAVVTLPAIPDGGLGEMYDRSLGYQADRGSPFSVWGQAPDLEPLQTVTQALAVGFGLLLFFVPRERTLPQIAALGAAVLIAVQLGAAHWLYPYAVWFAPLVLAALFSAYRPAEVLDSHHPCRTGIGTDQP